MEKLSANQVKIGILSNIRKRIVKESNNMIWTTTIGGDLRGILFTEKDVIIDNEIITGTGNDILYPTLEYPVLGKGSILTPTIGITKNEDLSPLLEYYGLTEFSRQDLQRFLDEVLLNKKWLKENHQLFGFIKNKYGPLTLTRTYYGLGEEIPESLGEMIYTVHEKKGLCLSRKEQKQYRAR